MTRMKREGKGDDKEKSRFLFAYLLGRDATHCRTDGGRIRGSQSIDTSCPLPQRTTLIAQLEKNLLAVLEILVQFLGQKDPLEKG